MMILVSHTYLLVFLKYKINIKHVSHQYHSYHSHFLKISKFDLNIEPISANDSVGARRIEDKMLLRTPEVAAFILQAACHTRQMKWSSISKYPDNMRKYKANIENISTITTQDLRRIQRPESLDLQPLYLTIQGWLMASSTVSLSLGSEHMRRDTKCLASSLM